ncbi:MAG TPA: response regulator [Candidatus Thermoplasmatota archaeon]|nr:response regulator [Candidatus Thermoplasmatota archaeon]
MTGQASQILWAEDNPQDRMLIQESVGDLAPDLTLIPDGVLLLEALHRGLPDLVVLDLKMPRLGGLEALRRIRSHPAWKDLPVTIFSSGNQPDEVAACQTLGVEEVVQKPVDFDLFSSAVQRIVRSARSRPGPPSPAALQGRRPAPP